MKTFSLSNLHELDNGKAVVAINHALRQAAADVVDREGDETKRKVVIEIEMAPELDPDTNKLDTIATKIIVKTRLPAMKTRSYKLAQSPNGVLLFSETSPFDPHQSGLYEEPAPDFNPETGEVNDKADDGTEI